MSTGAVTGPVRISSGVPGLDDILGGGLPAKRIYLFDGLPGTGKTTMAIQFLMEGRRSGERGLYVTLSESQEELTAVASSHGWNLDGISIFELTPDAEALKTEEQYTMFHPSEVELGQTTKAVLDVFERVRPSRVVFDSLSEMRLLARDPLRYRRQILGLKQFFSGKDTTVLLLDDRTGDSGEQLQSIVHGVFHLDSVQREYGAERRRFRVGKLRSSDFSGGYHDMIIETGGARLFPRLTAADTRGQRDTKPVPSGLPELDEMLGGGLDSGTATLIMGPAGSGKSVLATQYAVAAAQRGDRALLVAFDESPVTLVRRAESLNLAITPALQRNLLKIEQVDPAELSPGELAARICDSVVHEGAKVVVIDSLNGYLNAMPEERFLIAQMHELLSFLNQHDVLTILVSAQHGLVGSAMISPVDVSYLADSVILLRYFEAAGSVHKAISIMKKRSGRHERTIRELKLGPGVIVGPVLREFRGVLTGLPDYVGNNNPFSSNE